MKKDEFLKRLQENPRPVVIDLSAEWCHPCRVMEPALKRVEEYFQGKVDLWRFDADRDADLVRSLGVFGVPTLIVYQKGIEIDRRSGVQPEAGIRSLFEAAQTGIAAPKLGLGFTDRIIRLVAGAGLVGLGLTVGPAWLWLLVGGAVLFSAVYDRCPIWKAITSLLKRTA